MTGSLTTTVIIPNLNERRTVADAACSATRAGATQVIVVDGGSTDESLQQLSLDSVTVLRTAAGRALQQNIGARHATGDVLLFLHADCRLHPDAIQRASSWLEQSEDHIAGGFRQQITDPRRRYRLMEAGNAARVRTLGWVYGDQGLFVRRAVFEQIGGFPNVPWMEDWLLSRTLKRCGKIGLINLPLTMSARHWQRRGVIRQTLFNWKSIASALCNPPGETRDNMTHDEHVN